MSWQTDLATARARLAALEAAELKVLEGQQVSEVAYNGGSTKFARGATLAEIQRAIGATRAIIQRLSGGCRTGGAITPIF